MFFVMTIELLQAERFGKKPNWLFTRNIDQKLFSFDEIKWENNHLKLVKDYLFLK